MADMMGAALDADEESIGIVPRAAHYRHVDDSTKYAVEFQGRPDGWRHIPDEMLGAGRTMRKSRMLLGGEGGVVVGPRQPERAGQGSGQAFLGAVREVQVLTRRAGQVDREVAGLWRGPAWYRDFGSRRGRCSGPPEHRPRTALPSANKPAPPARRHPPCRMRVRSSAPRPRARLRLLRRPCREGNRRGPAHRSIARHCRPSSS